MKPVNSKKRVLIIGGSGTIGKSFIRLYYDENISFYGRVGILENLNSKEKEFLSEHIKNQIELINKTDSK